MLRSTGAVRRAVLLWRPLWRLTGGAVECLNTAARYKALLRSGLLFMEEVPSDAL